jgi:hypothetical protein
MHNFFTIEVEVERLRQERQLAAASDARAAQARPSGRTPSRLTRAFRSLTNVPPRTSPNTPIGALLELPRVPRPVAL